MLSYISPILLQANDPDRPAYVYKLFMTPMPLWGDNAWPWLLLPLCIAIAVVYKSIKCHSMKQVPKEAATLSVWIIAGMAIAAIALGLLVEALERFY